MCAAGLCGFFCSEEWRTLAALANWRGPIRSVGLFLVFRLRNGDQAWQWRNPELYAFKNRIDCGVLPCMGRSFVDELKWMISDVRLACQRNFKAGSGSCSYSNNHSQLFWAVFKDSTAL